jgi:hypothetical protein
MSEMPRILRTRIAAILLALASFLPAAGFATIYDVTGLWFNPNESGWGMNVIQQNNVLFITIFVYGADGKPTWYVASDTRYVAGTTGRYTGPLYAATGPYFGGVFNSNTVNVRQVGTITFDATCSNCNIYNNVIVTYGVDGVNVVKTVQQQAWTAVAIPASGYGAMHKVSSTTCSGGPSSSPMGFTFTYVGSTLTLNDANGVRYTVGLNNVPQYGATRAGVPSSLSVSNGPAFTQGAIQLESGNGVILNGLITGVGGNGCVAQYAFIASGLF